MTDLRASGATIDQATNESKLPTVSGWLQDGFHRFLPRYLRRHFDAIAIDSSQHSLVELSGDQSILIYGNHPSWWDPLVAHYLNRVLFPSRQFYAPIDAEALAQYRVFGKLGFYGVHLDKVSGANAFLKQSKAIMTAGNASLWMTPEGRFVDPRDRDVELMPGLSHLCSRLTSGWVMSFALEYVFWDERLPVCLARFGRPLQIADHQSVSKADWNERLTADLRRNQDQLREAAINRSSTPFDNLLVGQQGPGGSYDTFRRLKAWATGNRFRARHGERFE